MLLSLSNIAKQKHAFSSLNSNSNGMLPRVRAGPQRLGTSLRAYPRGEILMVVLQKERKLEAHKPLDWID